MSAPVTWCVIANIRAEIYTRDGKESVSAGTRHFSAGTKVWVMRSGWGDGMERVPVLGRARRGGRFVVVVTRSARLTNWRAKIEYDPAVLARLAEARFQGWTEAQAKAVAEGFARFAPADSDVRQAGHRVTAAARAIAADPVGRALLADAASLAEAWPWSEAPEGPPGFAVLADWLAARDRALEPERLRAYVVRWARRHRT